MEIGGQKRERRSENIDQKTALDRSLTFLDLNPLNSSSRSFCSKKLRRLSCSLRLGAQTQRGKFVKRKIEPEASTEVG